MQISTSEEFTKDWDWFAVDPTGSIGHFTSAGIRVLPKGVRGNTDAVAGLTNYFLLALSRECAFLVTKFAETRIPRPNDSESRTRFLASFTAMASKGIFSYNSDMIRGQNSGYYLVAKPLDEQKLTDFPPSIGALLERTRADLNFAENERICELDTLNW